MKKIMMTLAAGRMVLTFFFCCAMTTVVNAQTAEPESKMDKYLRLSTAGRWLQQGSARLRYLRVNCRADDGGFRKEGH